MSTYRRYQQARDTAWRALLQLEEKSLPVDAEALARRVGMRVLPFPGEEEARLRALIRQAGGGSAVSLRIRGAWHLFLREDALNGAARRFSIAHELGHLLLGHETRTLAPGVRAFCSRENAGDLLEAPQSLEDYAADIFAVRLLAPACLLHELHVDTPGGIMRLCGVPPQAAKLRAERMTLLNERDAFFTHPLEKQVRDAFLPFLRREAGVSLRPSPAAIAPPAAPGLPIRVAPALRPEGARTREEKKSRGAMTAWRRLLLWLLSAAVLAALILPALR